jgi:hypothetical protein
VPDLNRQTGRRAGGRLIGFDVTALELAHVSENRSVLDDCFKYVSLYEIHPVLSSECRNYNSVFSFFLKLYIFSTEK